jgi:hypothetical protein
MKKYIIPALLVVIIAGVFVIFKKDNTRKALNKINGLKRILNMVIIDKNKFKTS